MGAACFEAIKRHQSTQRVNPRQVVACLSRDLGGQPACPVLTWPAPLPAPGMSDMPSAAAAGCVFTPANGPSGGHTGAAVEIVIADEAGREFGCSALEQ